MDIRFYNIMNVYVYDFVLIFVFIALFKKNYFTLKNNAKYFFSKHTLIGLLLMYIIVFFNLFKEKSNIFQEGLNLLYILVALYVISQICNIRTKKTRLGIEWLGIPKEVYEMGFTKEFILSEISLKFQARLAKIEESKGSSRLKNQEHERWIRMYFKIFLENFMNDAKEIKDFKIFDIQIPGIKSKPLSMVEFKFRDDNADLRAMVSLDREEISNIVISWKIGTFCDEFIDWMDEIAEVIFLKLIPPCLKLSYYYSVYKDELLNKFLYLSKDQVCYNFVDILDFVGEDNRKNLNYLADEGIKVLRKTDSTFRLKLEETEELYKLLESIKGSNEVSKVLQIRKKINFLTSNNGMVFQDIKEKIKIDNIKLEVILLDFLNLLEMNYKKICCCEGNWHRREIINFYNKWCSKKESRDIRNVKEVFEAHVLLERYVRLLNKENCEKECASLKGELKEIAEKHKENYFINFALNTAELNFIEKGYRYDKKLKKELEKIKKEFIKERKKSIFGEMKEARDIQMAYIELLIGEWEETVKLLEKYKFKNNKNSQLYSNLADAYYNLGKYEKCIDSAHRMLDADSERIYEYINLKGCSLYRLWRETILEKEQVLAHFKNYIEKIERRPSIEENPLDQMSFKNNYWILQWEYERIPLRELKKNLEEILLEWSLNLNVQKRKVAYDFNEIRGCIEDNIRDGNDMFEDGMVYPLYNLGVISYYEKDFEKAKRYFVLLNEIGIYPQNENNDIYLRDCKYYIESCNHHITGNVYYVFNPFINKIFKKGENIDFYFSSCLKLEYDSENLRIADHDYQYLPEKN